jgi:hypothetical protein
MMPSLAKLPDGHGIEFLPQICIMLALCSAGSATGLAIDVIGGAPLSPGGLCLSAAGPLGALGRHWAMMPWMNGGMVAGGLMALAYMAAGERRRAMPWRQAIGGRAGFNLACHPAMLATMALGPLLAPFWGTQASAIGATGGMLASMIVAVAAVAISYRLVLSDFGGS